jgi:hypothetical protein
MPEGDVEKDVVVKGGGRQVSGAVIIRGEQKRSR